MKKSTAQKCLRVIAAMLVICVCLAACEQEEPPLFDPANPVVVTVWHYYNGAILNAFEQIIQEFNETVGASKGIIVEDYHYGNVAELESEFLASANREVGSAKLPSVFASYADTAYEALQQGLLANLDDYLTAEEQRQYLDSFIEEGRIGNSGELIIFPIAKSTEALLLNDTDWKPFAEACGLDYSDLNTLEGLTRVSELYYEWTDDATPDVPNDGKAFYGRDSLANLFIIASMSMDEDIFVVRDGVCTLNIDETVMRRLWDNYYVPYINGYFNSSGKFRSDSVKVGELLAYVGSTASASYFPSEVTVGGTTYPIDAKVLSAPLFEDTKNYMIQQGAGMVVTKSTEREEAASVEFLKYFTEIDNNIGFAAMSAYIPVKTEAADYSKLTEVLQSKDISISPITDAVLKLSLEELKNSEFHTSKAFYGATAARDILDASLQTKAETDRAAVLLLIEEGLSREEAAAMYTGEDNFTQWLNGFTADLQAVINVSAD